MDLKKIKPVRIKQPHFIWPEKEKKIALKLSKYFLTNKIGKNGLPDIIEKFESNFKKENKSKYCLALSSGTAALHIAYLASGIKMNDEVIISDYTFPATVIPLFLIGAKPVLCDVDRKFANIDPHKIEKLITKKTKAISVTHWWGQPCEMEKIVKISKKYNLKLIEDCAHSPGAKYKNKLVGNFGDFGCFSLDNNKLLASGEGGVLVTNNYDNYQKAILLSDFGSRLYKDIKSLKYRKFIQTGLGTKYRIHFLAAKLANEKLKNIRKMNSERKKIFDFFTKKISNSKILIPPKSIKNFKRGGFYGYKVIVKKNKNLGIDKLIKILKIKNVDARKTVTPPLHMTNTFNTRRIGDIHKGYSLFYKKNSLPNSKWFHNNHISFPSFFNKKHLKIINEYVRVINQIEKNYLK
tara:strand:+ start:7701 stop:8924 length:1224 start_codon:yes stop_codon:yes gene_type:complete